MFCHKFVIQIFKLIVPTVFDFIDQKMERYLKYNGKYCFKLCEWFPEECDGQWQEWEGMATLSYLKLHPRVFCSSKNVEAQKLVDKSQLVGIEGR